MEHQIGGVGLIILGFVEENRGWYHLVAFDFSCAFVVSFSQCLYLDGRNMMIVSSSLFFVYFLCL